MTIQQNYPNIRPSMSIDFANTKQLDPRITYSRASTGTYYDGKTVAKAEENLLLQSQSFDNGYWTKVAATVSANATTAPDGTTTAEFLILSTESNLHAASASVGTFGAGNTYTLSVYAKANGYDFISLGLHNGAISAGNETIQNFNLVTGTVASSFNTAPTSASITSVGNGWYRCVVTWVISTTTPNIALFVVNTDANPRAGWAANGTSGAYLWGAQLEQRSFATAYTPTTTAPITNYIPVLQTASAGTPRFDHNPITGESLGLLIEEQRTNLFTYSEDFTNAAWAKTSTTITANTVVAPDGTTTADLATGTASVTSYIESSAITVSASTTYSISLYVKAGSSTLSRVRVYNSALGTELAGVVIAWTAGVPSTSSTTGTWVTVPTYTSVGNGWYRVSGAFSSGSFTGIKALIYPDQSAVGASIYIWGAQLEAGAFATSYIPTVASQVTRAADSASIIGNNFARWYNVNEGTLYSDWGPCRGPASTIGSSVVTLTSGIGANDIEIDAFFDGVRSLAVANSATQGILVDAGVNGFNGAKAALGYQTNDFALSVKGRTPVTDTSAVVPFVNEMRIGAFAFNPGVLNGTIKRIAYYPRRLTNTQIQALTT